MCYIQITERCNFSCEHCCMSAGPEGDDMSFEVFKKALEIGVEYGEIVTIGGGEPTLHPQVIEMLGLAVLTLDSGLLIITNGSITPVALMLARAAKNGVLNAELSQDYYHDAIDPDVVDAFTKGSVMGPYNRRRYPDGDLRGIRDVGENVYDLGRAWDWGPQHGCACEGTFIDPRGDIWACGCRLEKIGTVWDGFVTPEYDTQCSRTQFELVEEAYNEIENPECPEDNERALEDLFATCGIIDRGEGWKRYQALRKY